MRFIRLALPIVIIILLFSGQLCASQISAYLCEIGLNFYKQGRYQEALHEFQKALLAEPEYEPALKYIRIIEQANLAREQGEYAQYIPPTFSPSIETPHQAQKETLDLIAIQREMISERQPVKPSPTYKEAELLGVVPVPTEKPRRTPLPATLIFLDSSLSKIMQPINIGQGQSVILTGSNIRRYLVTYPNTLTVVEKNANELLLTGEEFGYTYVHVWDDSGRWTTEFLIVPPEPEGPTYEEAQRIAGDRPGTFKLRYSLDWSLYETGRRLGELRRSSYYWSHNLGLIGPTPYGDIDSALTVRKDMVSADLTYLTLGLTKGKIGPFQGFTLRGFDFWPNFSNMAFPSATLRGAMVSSPAFNHKLNYTVFWGTEGGGRYGDLSPSLNKIKDSYLGGSYINFSPTEKQNYNFTITHGWGTDRSTNLKPYAYDLNASWKLLDNLGLEYEIGYDTDKFAHLLDIRYSQPKFSFTAQTRDINKSFYSITGQGWRAGQLGELMTFNYTPSEKLDMSGTLDIYQDRLYPAEDNKHRLNEDFNWQMNLRPDKDTTLGINYNIQNDLGKISQSRYQSPGFSVSKVFHTIRDISAYFNYMHQESKNYTSPTSDYINERLYGGLRFSLVGPLYLYYNNEINYLTERYYGNHVKPNANEVGVDWAGQFWSTPLYGNFRFNYRDEEDAVSDLSFLSGQDYIEGYAELSYRPTENNELYSSCRIRNNWKDGVNGARKGYDVDFNAGMRYLWDTGVRWDSVCNISGYVFKDLNGDGLKQRDDPPVEGMKVWMGNDKSQITDIFGYYKFKGVRGQKAYVSLDGVMLPAGYVPTVPIRQEIAIAQGKNIRVDFGIISRCEINGIVFEDVDGNGQYNKGDQGVQGVLILLENGLKSVTDGSGHYRFISASPGEHIVNLDLNSLPIYYLPETAISKKVTIFEGVAYTYNIPLKRIKKQ